ncbi:MAG: 16S rRNA (guanine(966)-N(2))-methyltransferase RsmD [Deltaproteobacteria bacterium]|nr:16S rRNA (guanine(966)-N(2))-methyltransferase RsmD [Deltaproteobacteria bacterium]
MRVVGGAARGRRLRPPQGRFIRPTSDRIRESIFDLLGPGPTGPRALDLFAGTGALGIEALSRGSAQAVFVERDRRALALIRENLQRCGFRARAELLCRDALRFLRAEPAEPFDLILLDPPYGQGLLEPSLRALGSRAWLRVSGCVLCESEAQLDPPAEAGCLALGRRKIYGRTQVLEYRQPVDKRAALG